MILTTTGLSVLLQSGSLLQFKYCSLVEYLWLIGQVTSERGGYCSISESRIIKGLIWSSSIDFIKQIPFR
jgi:hypothetical protein